MALAEKTKLNLPVILPGIPDAADACVARLLDRLKDREGISDVHVVPGADDQPAQLCIH